MIDDLANCLDIFRFRRRFGGSEFYHRSMGNCRDGPSTAEEFSKWPDHIVRDLIMNHRMDREAASRMRRIQNCLGMGSVVSQTVESPNPITHVFELRPLSCFGFP